MEFHFCTFKDNAHVCEANKLEINQHMLDHHYAAMKCGFLELCMNLRLDHIDTKIFHTLRDFSF